MPPFPIGATISYGPVCRRECVSELSLAEQIGYKSYFTLGIALGLLDRFPELAANRRVSPLNWQNDFQVRRTDHNQVLEPAESPANTTRSAGCVVET